MTGLHLQRICSLPSLGRLGVSALLSALVGIAPAAATPRGWPGARPAEPPLYGPSARVDDFAPDGYAPDSYPYPREERARSYGGQGYPPVTSPSRAQLQAQAVQCCNIGRLVGGLFGGGVGYAASRKDGRSWAVPLGALLGQQIGCNAGNGRAPLPW